MESNEVLITKFNYFIDRLTELYPEKLLKIAGNDRMALMAKLDNYFGVEPWDYEKFDSKKFLESTILVGSDMNTMSIQNNTFQNGIIGDIMFDSSTNRLLFYDGTAWIPLA